MNVVCRNRALNNALINDPALLPSGYAFNILVTTDQNLFNKRLSQSPDGKTKATKIHDCRQYQQLADGKNGFFREAIDKSQIQFSRWGFPRFESGKLYYFYTTSDGTEKSLTNKKGPRSTRHMYFEVFVCRKSEGCSARSRVSRCIRSKRAQRQTSSGGGKNNKNGGNNNNNNQQKLEPDWVLFGSMAGGCFLAGFLIATLIYIARDCYKEIKRVKRENENPNSGTFESPEHSELLKENKPF